MHAVLCHDLQPHNDCMMFSSLMAVPALRLGVRPAVYLDCDLVDDV